VLRVLALQLFTAGGCTLQHKTTTGLAEEEHLAACTGTGKHNAGVVRQSVCNAGTQCTPSVNSSAGHKLPFAAVGYTPMLQR
jgi:hypothetical protein